MRSTTVLDTVILAFFYFGAATGGFPALVFLTSIVVAGAREINRMLGTGAIREAVVEDGLE